MAVIIDSPVLRELATILEHADPFPHPCESNFETCRGFKKDNKGRCRIPLKQGQDRIDSLLSQFRSMTKCVDTKSLHDQMQTFITLTHCKRYHRDDALKAFHTWKQQRKAATSNIRPVTPSSSVASHNDSFEDDSDTNSMTFSSLERGSLDYGKSTLDYSMSFSSLERGSSDCDESTLDSHIEDRMKSLKIATSTRHASTQTEDNGIDEIDRKFFEMIGDVHFPRKGKDYNHGKICQTIEESFSKKSQAGILYVLEHTEIPGLFKIGRSKFPKDVRHNQNCYKTETEGVHATKEPFFGYERAETLALKILRHKRLLIVECARCTNTHQEWFLATKDEVVNVVKLAERWFKMPTYELQDGVYKLTPEADGIHKKMYHFSVFKMNKLMDETYGSSDVSCALPNAASTAAAPKSGASAERAAEKAAERTVPRVLVDEVLDTTPPPRYKTRAKSPAARTGAKGESPLLETEEIFSMHQRRSRETTPDGDGNYTLVTEFTRTICTKVSTSELNQGSGVYDFSKPVVFGSGGEKERHTEVKVQEVQQV